MYRRRKRPRDQPRRRWRDYKTASGRRPVKEFIAGLSDVDAAAIVAAMKEVEIKGTTAAKHLRDDLYEVVADGDRQTFRILFAPEGNHGQVLLSLVAFSKKTQKARKGGIELAFRRLADWRRRSGRKASN
jgi:phage-related protein